MPETKLIHGLPWTRDDDGDTESWRLDIDGVHVWVKNYGDNSFDHWRGWRIGRGGSPLVNLNDSKPFDTSEAAMNAAYRVAVKTAFDHVEDAREDLDRRIRALSEVVLPL